MTKLNSTSLSRRLAFKNRRVLPVVASTVVLGVIAVVIAFASGVFSVVEPENGTLSSGATKVALTGASGGSVVKFGAGATPTPTPTPAKTPTPTPAPTPATTGPSGEAAPVGDLPGWKQVFVDNFTKDAPTGSWGTSNAGAVIYTGDHGGKWNTYPDGWSSTYTNGAVGYMPSQVLSVHNGSLDFYLHNVNGRPAGANPSPVLASGSQYQTYGRYTARFRVDSGLSEYYVAWLLWPQNESQWQCAESDFPEGGLNGNIGGFAHYGCGGAQDSINGGARFDSGWHTYTQEWMPGSRKYYVDGRLVGTSTHSVYASPERWQLQTEVNGGGTHAGHLLVDWVAVYAKQ